jgi:hypothetical protein
LWTTIFWDVRWAQVKVQEQAIERAQQHLTSSTEHRAVLKRKFESDLCALRDATVPLTSFTWLPNHVAVPVSKS